MKFHLHTTAAVACLFLTACGGGGGDSPPTTGATPSGGGGVGSLAISGVAATGKAMAGAKITAKCASGSTTDAVTVNADGSYSLKVPQGELPCMVEAKLGTTTILHSFATSSGTTQITPLTEWLAAYLTGQDPATYFQGLSDGKVLGAALTSGALSDAQTAVKKMLSDAGITGAPDDLIHATLVPATGPSNQGNDHDKLLETLQAKLSEGMSDLKEVASVLAASATAKRRNSDNDSSDGNASSPQLPPDKLFQKIYTPCTSLRNGDYRVVNILPSTTFGPNEAVTQTGLLTIDTSGASPSVTLKGSTAPSAKLTPSSGSSCSFTSSTGQQLAVSAAGVIVIRTPHGNGIFHSSVAFPAQTIALSELQGTWNAMGSLYLPPFGKPPTTTGGNYVSNAFTVTLDDSGHLTKLECFGDAVSKRTIECSPPLLTDLPVLSVNPEGGFDMAAAPSVASTSPLKRRLFAFRSGSGDMMSIDINAQGEINVLTRQRTLITAPLRFSSTNLDLTFYGVTNLNPFSLRTLEVTSTDSATSSFAASVWRKADPSKEDEVNTIESFTVNKTRPGYLYRAPDTKEGNMVYETYSLQLKGTGMTFSYVPTVLTSAAPNAVFVLSVVPGTDLLTGPSK